MKIKQNITSKKYNQQKDIFYMDIQVLLKFCCSFIYVCDRLDLTVFIVRRNFLSGDFYLPKSSRILVLFIPDMFTFTFASVGYRVATTTLELLRNLFLFTLFRCLNIFYVTRNDQSSSLDSLIYVGCSTQYRLKMILLLVQMGLLFPFSLSDFFFYFRRLVRFIFSLIFFSASLFAFPSD